MTYYYCSVINNREAFEPWDCEAKGLLERPYITLVTFVLIGVLGQEYY